MLASATKRSTASEQAGAIDDPLDRLEREMLAFVVRSDARARQSTLYDRMDRAAYRIARQLDAVGSLTVCEIARALELDGSTVTRQVAAMEDRQHAARRVHPSDGRAWKIHLTKSGRREMEAITAARRAWFSEVLEDWGVADVDRFGRLLERFNRAAASR